VVVVVAAVTRLVVAEEEEAVGRSLIFLLLPDKQYGGGLVPVALGRQVMLEMVPAQMALQVESHGLIYLQIRNQLQPPPVFWQMEEK
jgi:hypothetical protein